VLVLDLYILLRAVFDPRVRALISGQAHTAGFFVPDSVFATLAQQLPGLMESRDLDPATASSVLDALAGCVTPVGADTYTPFLKEARVRLPAGDADSWPVLATALALSCPIWTEDETFFGAGVPTWKTGTVGYYLKTLKKPPARR
jgi:predicted nucleic acid-binding protein